MMGVVTERDRMVLRQWAEEHMGEQNAEALMNCLPPNGWGDLATKSAVEGVRTEVDALRTDVEKMEKSLRADVQRNHEATQTQIETAQTVLTATFTAQLATEIGKVHEKIGEVTKEIAKVHEKMGDVGRMKGSHIATLVVTIMVAVFGPTVVDRFFPSPPPPAAQIVIQSPAGP